MLKPPMPVGANMYYSIALGFLLALAAFGTAAFIADRRYGRHVGN